MRLSERLEAITRDYICDDLVDSALLDAVHDALALARRVEEAPSGEVWQHACIGGQRTSNIIITREPEDGLAVIGKRVRIVEE